MIGQKVSLLFNYFFFDMLPFRPKKIKLGRRYLVFIWFGVVYSPFPHCPWEIRGKSGTCSRMGDLGV